ncbi:hypothetical protein EVAR_93903_1 [Eumeta japonica]|uniref:Uncharacterized protein n=1 Tax=Eumeta variegata TaxID=151549 RepID=A0A4C1TP12_EUMVA|nr:hypothetical protein EVAR_93903_1 [Eumeta japonica]
MHMHRRVPAEGAGSPDEIIPHSHKADLLISDPRRFVAIRIRARAPNDTGPPFYRYRINANKSRPAPHCAIHIRRSLDKNISRTPYIVRHLRPLSSAYRDAFARCYIAFGLCIECCIKYGRVTDALTLFMRHCYFPCLDLYKIVI